MVGKWLTVLPLLLDLTKVSLQPITSDSSEDTQIDGARRIRQLNLQKCCPCPDMTTSLGARSHDDGWMNGPTDSGCTCQPRGDDAEGSASFLLPALRAIQPFVKQAEQKSDPKPLLQPEVGLASSVLETLRQATDEEYQEALARDAARTAAILMESTLDPPDDSLNETPKNIVKIFLNPKTDEMDDNLPEQSHIQETRCIHPPLQSIHRNGPLIANRPTLEIIHKNGDVKLRRPTPIIEVIDIPQKPIKKLKNKSLLHRNLHDMDNGIGASNIRERVIQPNLDSGMDNLKFKSNPALFTLFGSNIENIEDSSEKNFEKNVNEGEAKLNQKSKPKINIKLRELIENLQLKSDQGKSKLPVIDLKKHLSTSSRTLPLQSKTIEKSVYNKPLLLKDILKLKDVELIPRKDLTNKLAGKSLYLNLKLHSENSRINLGNDNSEESIITKQPVTFEIGDTDISPSNTKPVFESNRLQANNIIKENLLPAECVSSLENNDLNSKKTISVDAENNFDYGDTDNEEDPNIETLLLDNCDNPTEGLVAQNLANSENQKEGLSFNEPQKEKAQELEDNDDMLNQESNDNAVPIELLDELDFPVEFDNSSFNQKSEGGHNNEFHHIHSSNAVQSTLNDHVGNTSSNDLQIKEGNDNFNMDIEGLENTVDNCITQENFSQKSNLFPEGQNSEPNHQELASLEQESLEDCLNLPGNAREAFLDVNEDLSKVSFKDLQDMSDSILRISDECEPHEETVITNNNNNYNAISEKNFQEKLSSAPDIEANVDSESEPNEAVNLNSKENLCQTLIADETSNNFGDGSNYLPSLTENPEMIAAPSEPESKVIVEEQNSSDDSPRKLFRNVVDNHKNEKIFAQPSDLLSNVLQRNTHSDFLNNLKTKFDGLFSTSDKIMPENIVNSPDDNINESSNTNPIIAKFNQIQNSDKLQRTPQSLFSQISPFKLSMPLDSYKNKLTVPKYADLPNDRPNFLKLPIEVPRPLDNTLDPSLNFADLSEKLRSHTENTLQNVKDTIESTIKDPQSFRISRPTEIFDTQDVLENLSDKRNDMKEKLEAIHLDFNDRISSFQQSILDHLNQPLSRISTLQEESKHERTGYIPVRKESLLPNVKDEHNLLTLRENGSNRGRKTNINMKSPSIPKASEAPRFRNSERNPTLPNPTTTAIPSFMLRPKVLKTNIDLTPKLNHETLSKATMSKIPNLLESKLTKSGRTNNLFEKSPSPPSFGSSSRNKIPLKSLKNEFGDDDLSEESPVNKLRKTLLQRAQNQKSRDELRKSEHGLSIAGNSLNSDVNIDSSNKKELLLSRIKDGRSKFGSGNNIDMIRSPTTQVDNKDPAQLEEGFRLVEPMKENVPYKCKLICYRDK